MKYRIFISVISLGLGIGVLHYFQLLDAFIPLSLTNFFSNIYLYTFCGAFLYLCYKSNFLKENLKSLVKFFLIGLTITFILNLFNEFNWLQIPYIDTITYLLFISIPILYLQYYMKHKKTIGTTLKLLFVLMVYLNNLLYLWGISSTLFFIIIQSTFWMIFYGSILPDLKKHFKILSPKP
jgi:hypothetical protein